MPYANIPSVKAQLGNSAPSGDARLNELNEAWSVWIERRTGRRWGVLPATSARSVFGRGGKALLLPVPVLAVSAVTVGGVAVSPTAYARWLLTPDGEAWALARIDGQSWPLDGTTPTVTVTAEWADALALAAPADIVEAVGVLVRYSALADKAGPTGVLGPDGEELRLPDPTDDKRVQLAIEQRSIKTWVPAWTV